MGMSFHGVWSPVSSDAELIAAVRGGDSVAFGQLYERHSAAARAVARQYTNSAADAEDVVSDSFAKVFTILQGGGGPDVAFRAYLFTVIRRVAIASLGAGRRVQPTDDLAQYEGSIGSEAGVDEPAMAGFERGVVAKAYDSLPERWQAVLWYTEVEGLQPAQIGPILGLTANGVAALAYRAREGLRQAYLQNHLTTVKDESCRAVSDKLGAYVRGGLAKREQALVDQHLDECLKCRGLVLELADVNHGMRVVIAPLVLGLAGLAALQHGLPFAGAAAGAGAAGAAGAGSAGTGAAVGSGVGVASGVGSGGAAAGTGGALVGAGVGSAATVGGGGAAGFGAIGAFVGSLPTGVLGVLVGGVVIAVGVVSAGVLGVFSPGPGTQLGIVADLSPTPAGTTASGTSPTAAPSPGDSPSPSDTSTPSDTPTPGATGGTNPANVPPAVGTRSTSPARTPTPTPTPTPRPTPTPTTTPTPTPRPTPTPTTTPVTPAKLDITVPAITTIEKNTLGVVTFTVKNTGQTTANKLTASVDLPAAEFLGSEKVGGDWNCTAVDGSNKTARCTLPSLAPGATSALRIAVHANGNTSSKITATISATGVGPVQASTTLRMASHLAFSP